MSATAIRASLEADTAVVCVDERVYTRAAVLRTAYWFTDRAYVLITKLTENTFDVRIKPKPPSLESPAGTSADELAGEFCNQLLDHQLREDIAERTNSVRELLVAKALFDAGITAEPPGDVRDPVAC
jgi:His-Xaa-Ser system protein HxsD